MLLKPSPFFPMPSPTSLALVDRFLIASTSSQRNPFPPFRNVKHAFRFRAHDELDCDSTIATRTVRVVRVLYQLMENQTAVFGANDLVQVLKALVDLRAVAVRKHSRFKLLANLFFQILQGPRVGVSLDLFRYGSCPIVGGNCFLA